MSYTARLTITIPADLLEVGRAISRALDPDVGGADSWMPTDAGYVADTPCTAEFRDQAQAMLADPAVLHAVVAADYAARWADLMPPTLEQCVAFCALAVVGSDTASVAYMPDLP